MYVLGNQVDENEKKGHGLKLWRFNYTKGWFSWLAFMLLLPPLSPSLWLDRPSESARQVQLEAKQATLCTKVWFKKFALKAAARKLQHKSLGFLRGKQQNWPLKQESTEERSVYVAIRSTKVLFFLLLLKVRKKRGAITVTKSPFLGS